MDIEEKIKKDALMINQSKIKRLKASTLCPHKYFLEEVSGEYRRPTSVAMNAGQCFEYKLWKTLPKEGNIPVMPGGRKKGSKSVGEERMDQQVLIFDSLMKRYGIKVIKTNFQIEIRYNGEIIVHGTLDSLVEFNGRPYIMDLKLGGDVNTTFGDFAWGNFKTKRPDGIYTHIQSPDENGKKMDVIQSHYYMWLIELLTKRKFGFLYAVFDIKAKGPEHKIIEIPYDLDERRDMIERLDVTKHKLDIFRSMNYNPIASLTECESCKFMECKSRFTEENMFSDITPLTIPVIEEKVALVDSDEPW